MGKETKFHRAFILLLFLVLTFGFFHQSVAPDAFSQQDDREHWDYVKDQLVIRLKAGTRSSVLQSVLSEHGLIQRDSISKLNLFLVDTPKDALLDKLKELVLQNPNVLKVEKNYIYRAFLTPNDQYYPFQYHHPLIQDPQAWDIETGSTKTVIAILDTGVQSNHPELSGKVLPGANFTGFSSNSDTTDNNGHGTACAGSSAARANNFTGVAGICWDCLILPVKVLGDNGSGTFFDVIEGINYVAGYAQQHPDERVIINMSLGGFCSGGSSEQAAINNAWNAGVLIFAAAGNSSSSTPECPAARDNVEAVSATDQNDNLASFSNFGTHVDISAPGVNIATTWRGSSYIWFTGTSAATPVAAGVAGLVWSKNPTLTNSEIRQVLFNTSVDLGAQGKDSLYGNGRVNSYNAVEAAGGGGNPTPTPTPPPPQNDTTPPSVQITQPLNRTVVSGNVTISASASDNVQVAEVRFYVNGSLINTDTTSPYSATWNAPTSRAAHIIEAVAVDTSGNTASDQIRVGTGFNR